MNERIRFLRKELGLSQEEFGARLHVSSSAISFIEKGERTITERMAQGICREFGVSSAWLAIGEGDPFRDSADSVGTLMESLLAGENETARAVFTALARLGGEEWRILKNLVMDISKELQD